MLHRAGRSDLVYGSVKLVSNEVCASKGTSVFCTTVSEFQEEFEVRPGCTRSPKQSNQAVGTVLGAEC